jgi:hypothetical protein
MDFHPSRFKYISNVSLNFRAYLRVLFPNNKKNVDKKKMRQTQDPPNIDAFNKSIPMLVFIHHPNKVLCYNEEYNRGQGTSLVKTYVRLKKLGENPFLGTEKQK